MPFKRPQPGARPSSGASSRSGSRDDNDFPVKRAKLSTTAKALPDVKIYIVQAKMDSRTVADLLTLAERHCAKLCQDPEDADVILTAISMKRRLERHVPLEIAKNKAVLKPSWLRDSVAEGSPLPCQTYVALQDLYTETIQNCPNCSKKSCECEDSDQTSCPPSAAPSSQASSASPPTKIADLAAPKSPTAAAKDAITAADKPSAPSSPAIPAHLLPPDPPIPTDTSRLSYTARYACQRASPLVCPNQALAVELDVIKRSRALEGEERSALSYSRAVSILKAYPHVITSRKQVEKLPYLGAKILGLIEEFLDKGSISEARSIAESPRFQALSTFSSIYGIGPTTARRLHALGLQTLEDLEVYYGVDETITKGGIFEIGHTQGGKARDGELGETWIKVALGLRHDLSIKIPRDEVDEIGRVVMHELNQVEPGCVSTIVGGHRRGKPESNDVDVVFTHPDGSKIKGLCKRLVKRLYEQGMVTHVMHTSGFHGQDTLRGTHGSLETALTIFILPQSSPFYRGTRRRLDLIFALPEVYWCAVIGWSGSVMFQRDLRQWAKDKLNMKFDSTGITRRSDSHPVYAKTEKEVFDLFELAWVDPTLRNADV